MFLTLNLNAPLKFSELHLIAFFPEGPTESGLQVIGAFDLLS